MPYSIRHLNPDDKICQQNLLPMFADLIPQQALLEALEAEHAFEQRERRFNMVSVVYLLLGMALLPRKSIQDVLHTLWHPLRQLFPSELRTPHAGLPATSSFIERRYQLSARVLVHLFRIICRPLATHQTPGAFWKGWRLMALDGTLEAVPDTEANARAFGRLTNGKKANPFPQIRGVYLIECGTHAIVDVCFSSCHLHEQRGAHRVLRSVEPGMLLLWDSGNHGYPLLAHAVERGGHVLSRLPAEDRPLLIRQLPDGSWLAALRPREHARPSCHHAWILVRIVAYQITTPLQAHQTHRLLTTLLDEERYPAHDLIELYHERWEVELVIDELDTHQRLCQHPLRSKRPVGVIQELYALLLAHYAIRSLMHRAALGGEGAEPLDPDRLSFTHAVVVIEQWQGDFVRAQTPTQREELTGQLLHDLRRPLLPPRRLRFFPRVVKQHAKKFEVKRPHHLSLAQLPPDTTFRSLIVLRDASLFSP
jgi:hypothetical protein